MEASFYILILLQVISETHIQTVLSPMADWKKYARIILPHVGLVIFSVLYAVGGALAFYYLERPNEIAVRRESLRDISAQRKLMLDELWVMLNNESVSDEEIERLANLHVNNVTQVLFEAFNTRYISASHLQSSTETSSVEFVEEECKWTFTTALFFTTTLLTTIGYGNLVPLTVQGRMFCIIYSLFGVPLILITVADMGKFLSENIVWLYAKYAQAKKIYTEKKTVCIASVIDEVNRTMKDELFQIGLREYISIPMLLIVGILLGYIAIGAVLFASWEHWDFFSGFYFSFITMTTQAEEKVIEATRDDKSNPLFELGDINLVEPDLLQVGFGDIVPIRQEYFLLDLLYIVVGLAITTMCIDLVGIQYIRKIHYFGRAIKDARYALVNVGGRMVHVPDVMRYASVLQQKYGEKRQGHRIRLKGAYIPEDLPLIRYIDYGSLANDDNRMHFLTNIFNKSNELSTV
ncbi:Ion channel [Onchocerca flexuosa]|uniref:Ion channel n=1 Tax=Onchocerca flexuosa TaxID=387005 RepID=A0A238C3R7_9BILA|nr:Ion channel [Onchocerca flexuosa]